MTAAAANPPSSVAWKRQSARRDLSPSLNTRVRALSLPPSGQKQPFAAGSAMQATDIGHDDAALAASWREPATKQSAQQRDAGPNPCSRWSSSSGSSKQSSEQQQKVQLFEVQQIDLLAVERVDAIKHTFQAELFLQLVLRKGGLDPELSNPESVFPLDKATGKPTFRPSALWFWEKVEFTNAQRIEFKDVHPVRREGDDLVLRFRVSGVFGEVMELQEYPFDVQALTFSIQLNCRTSGPMPVRFAVPADLEQSVDEQGCALIAIEYERQAGLIVEATEVERAKNRAFPTLRVSMMLKRRPESVLVNCAAPMGIFALLSGLSYLIPVSDQGTRLELTINLILTAAAYKYAISTMTPAVPYLTLLDKYALSCFFFIALMTVEAALLGWFATDDEYYAPGSDSRVLVYQVDRAMCWVSIVVFVLLHLFFWWRTGGSSQRRRRMSEALALVRQEAHTVQRYPTMMRQVGSDVMEYTSDVLTTKLAAVAKFQGAAVRSAAKLSSRSRSGSSRVSP